jgi:hypothetical protein
VAAYAIVLLKFKFHIGNLVKEIARRAASMARRCVPRAAAWLQRASCCRRALQPLESHEMKAERTVDGGDLKPTLLA